MPGRFHRRLFYPVLSGPPCIMKSNTANANGVGEGCVEIANVQLTESELVDLCDALCVRLSAEWHDGEKYETYADLVAAWRRDNADFLDRPRNSKAHFTREQDETFLAEQTRAADLLEKLARRLPAEITSI
jgi:hypothetical protein